MAESTLTVDIPEGYYPPFAVVTEHDHTAWILVATALGLSWSLMFGAIRVFVRWTNNRSIGKDDILLAVATGLTIVQSSILFKACDQGLGKSLELLKEEAQDAVQKMYYTVQILVVVILGLSKLSVSFFLLRLTQIKHHRLVFHAGVGLIAAWTFASTLAVSLQCNLSQPWLLVGQNCSGSFLRLQVISAFDILSEIALVLMTVMLVWNLNTTISNKAVVVGTFGLRLGLIIAIGFRIGTFDATGRAADPTLQDDLFIVWTQTELNYSLISATIPTIQSFVNNLNTQFGGIGTSGSGRGYGSGYGLETGPGNYQLSNLKSVDKSEGREAFVPSQQGTGVNAEPKYGIWVAGNAPKGNHVPAKRTKGGGDATSVDSNDSRQMIIQKDVTWEVHMEDHC